MEGKRGATGTAGGLRPRSRHAESDPVEGEGPPAYEEVHVYPNRGQFYVRYTLFGDGEVVLSAFVFEGARDDVTVAARASIASVRAE